MRQFRHLIVVFAIVLMALTGSALADSTTVNIELTGVGGANGGGVYTYPYNFTVNGNPASLICDAFDNEVWIGESWTATVSSLLGNQGMFSNTPNSQLNYETAGLIFNDILSGKLNSVAGNWAIWGLFSTNAQNNPFFTSSGASSIESQYLQLAQNATADTLAPLRNLILYTPVPGSQPKSLMLPQEYIGISAPEPGEYALLLTTLLFGLALFSMKKRQSLKGTSEA